VQAPGVAQSITRHRTKDEIEREAREQQAAEAKVVEQAEAARKAEELRRQQVSVFGVC
jgi:hypothetical protein